MSALGQEQTWGVELPKFCLFLLSGTPIGDYVKRAKPVTTPDDHRLLSTTSKCKTLLGGRFFADNQGFCLTQRDSKRSRLDGTRLPYDPTNEARTGCVWNLYLRLASSVV